MMISVGEIKNFEIFKDLNDDELNEIISIGEKQSFESQQKIFREGSWARKIYLLLDGEVKIQFKSNTQSEVLTIETISRGDIFGWSALTEPYSLTATALSSRKSVVIAWRGDALRDLFERNIRIGYVFMDEIARVISSRYKHTRAKLIEVRDNIVGVFK